MNQGWIETSAALESRRQENEVKYDQVNTRSPDDHGESLSGKVSGLVIAAECVTTWASFAKPWWSPRHNWWGSHNLERYVAGENERFYLILPKAVPEPSTEISVNLEGMWTNEFCDIIPKYTTAIRKINHCRCTYMSLNLRKIDFLGTLGGV